MLPTWDTVRKIEREVECPRDMWVIWQTRDLGLVTLAEETSVFQPGSPVPCQTLQRVIFSPALSHESKVLVHHVTIFLLQPPISAKLCRSPSVAERGRNNLGSKNRGAPRKMEPTSTTVTDSSQAFPCQPVTLSFAILYLQ
jgi:hypothetical protein